jgi:hypothetical protein
MSRRSTGPATLAGPATPGGSTGGARRHRWGSTWGAARPWGPARTGSPSARLRPPAPARARATEPVAPEPS